MSISSSLKRGIRGPKSEPNYDIVNTARQNANKSLAQHNRRKDARIARKIAAEIEITQQLALAIEDEAKAAAPAKKPRAPRKPRAKKEVSNEVSS